MDALSAFLIDQPAWHWWALGAILLALEIASTTQYLLWPGIAALATGVLKFVLPALDGRFAVFLFAVFSVVATILWKRSSFSRAERHTHHHLNDRSAQYVGRVVKAEDDFVSGRGAVRVDDTRWIARVVDGSAPVRGDMLEVAGADGSELKVRLAPGSAMLGRV
jgi:membrane protein implicated in regulation of membrane protease activity